jgi:hypothetical protein
VSSIINEDGRGEMYRFAVSGSFGNGTFSTTSPDADAVDDVALFCFVSKTTGLVGSGWTGCAVNDVELTVFPATHTEKETENVGLFVLIKLCYPLAITLTRMQIKTLKRINLPSRYLYAPIVERCFGRLGLKVVQQSGDL